MTGVVIGRTPLAPLAWRVFDVIQHEGPGALTRRILRRAARPNLATVRARIQRLAAERPLLPIVLSPTIEWEVALFQRPQQLALALAQLGHPVFYVTSTQSASLSGIHTVHPGVHLVDDLKTTLAALERFGLLVFSTAHPRLDLPMLRALGERAVIAYDFLDEQHGDIYRVEPGMRARHEEMLRDADVVLVTADRLEEQTLLVRSPERPVLRSPNAVDLTHFDGNLDRPKPTELRGFKGRPIIGYYGALASWFDYALVRMLAEARPGYEIVLIGVDYDRSIDAAGLTRLPNVHVLGPRRYQDLPDYLAQFDVATIPFLLNEVTESTSPIKLFEYMAGGRSIVTTDLRECRKYESVLIAHSTAEYIELVDRAIALGTDPAYRAKMRTEAQANSWHQRAEELSQAWTAAARRRGWS